MKILISGCSFTHWPQYPGGPNVCWPTHLKFISPEHEYTNLAEPAAGNQYICDSVIRHCLTETPDLVLVMWSGVSRLDYLTSLDDPDWQALFHSYGFFRHLSDENLGYIFSGGKMGTWYKHPVAHKMFYEMYKVSTDLSLAYINLMEMLKLQEFLKARNIKYIFSSYVNYWKTQDVPEFNGDFSVANLSGVAKIISAMDFDQWLFLDQDKNTIFDLALSHDDFMPDGIHPGSKSHTEWAHLVNGKINSLI